MNEKNEKLIIVGDGEFARLAYEYFTYDSSYEVVAFSAEKEFIRNSELNGLPVVPVEDLEKTFDPEKFKVYTAITFTQLNRVRKRLYKTVKEKGFSFANYISSKSSVWQNAQIGENCFIGENNVVQPFTKIGNNVIICCGNNIAHRTVIHDHCYISAQSVISGFCEIGENSFLGVNSTIADYIKVEKDNLIGAGAVIIQNTKEGQIYQGNPAKAKGSSLRYFEIRDNAVIIGAA